MNYNESKSVAKFFRKAYGLRNVDRCSTLPKFRTNSVAEHSYFFTLMALILGKMENLIIEKEENVELLDIKILLERSILHDIEESITGDILFTTHQYSSQFRKELIEIRKKIAKNELFKELDAWNNLSEELYSIWLDAKDETPEGRFLFYIDKLELLFVAIEERNMGNTYFEKIINNCWQIISTSKFDTIKSLAFEIMQIQPTESLPGFSKE